MTSWDERYAGDDYLFGEAPNAFLARQAALLPATGRALAVADGEGRNGVWLAQHGMNVDSVDGSVVAQRKAARLAEKAGVTLNLILADMSDWAWPEAAYDVVAGIFIQFAGPSLCAKMFAGMRRALKPGGVMLIEGYGPRQLEYRTGGPSDLANLYTEDLLRAEFGSFEIIELTSYDTRLSEGSRHDGMSALVDLVARKPVV